MENEKPQWKRVLEMLQSNQGGVTTGMFCSARGLAAEYRRAISELRRKKDENGNFYNIKATRLTDGCFIYNLIPPEELKKVA